jgi:hypothetical protein
MSPTDIARSTLDDAIRPATVFEEYPSICIICLEQLAITPSPNPDPVPEAAVLINKCGHVFGRNCLTEWMREHNTCPVCRVEFFSKVMGNVHVGIESPDFALEVYTSVVRVSAISREVSVGERHDEREHR